jgi:hypothetical protein
VVEPSVELLTLLSESTYVPESPPFLGDGKVDELQYVRYLKRTLADTQENVLVRLPSIARRAQQLQTTLAADDYEGVARLWMRDQFQLWSTIEAPYIRRELDLDAPPGSDATPGTGQTSSGGVAYERAQNPDGTVVLMQQGPPYIVLGFTPRDRMGPPGERSRDLANRLATAFEQGIKPDLIRVFNFLARIESVVPALENLSRKIEAELARLKRLTITALISNTGGTPVSISKPRCDMHLYVGGFSHHVGRGENSGRWVVERGNRDLQLDLVDGDGRPPPPLVVEAGGVKVITGVYSELLSGEPLPDGGSLADLLYSSLRSERAWDLSLEAVLPRDPARKIASPKISFSSFKEPDGQDSLAEPSETDSLKATIEARDRELSATTTELSTLRTRYMALESTVASLASQSGPTVGTPADASIEQAGSGVAAALLERQSVAGYSGGYEPE